MLSRIRKPSPALIVGVIAIVLALGGTSFAAKKLLGLGSFKDGVKDKTVGVGKLHYVTNTQSVTNSPATGTKQTANCPSGFKPIGGATKTDAALGTSTYVPFQEYPVTNGWTSVFVVGAPAENISVIAICAKSRAITGAPPTS